MRGMFPHASSIPMTSASLFSMVLITLSKSTSSPPYSILKVITLSVEGPDALPEELSGEFSGDEVQAPRSSAINVRLETSERTKRAARARLTTALHRVVIASFPAPSVP
jgi:hypothetical protein